MKKLLSCFWALTLTAWSSMGYAFVSGSTGTLGAFNPTTNTVISLPSNGTLNYTTINIPTGVTVTFRNNSSNSPAYMLATGDVTIAGTINAGQTAQDNTKAGPGGFNGGYGSLSGSLGGNGLGPGGATALSYYGAGGGFGSAGVSNGSSIGGPAYGNAQLLPLIGGSGGSGVSCVGCTGAYSSGGGGGGALLIASPGTITVTGSITANGGNGGSASGIAGGGSGGAIKLMANTITGDGAITAIGGNGVGGAAGRIRLEANSITRSAATIPPYTSNTPGSIFLSNVPTLTIASIAGTAAPSTPGGSYSQPDILLPTNTTNPVAVVITATNIPLPTSVQVSAIPQYGTPSITTISLSGTQQSSSGTASLTLATGNANVIIAQATFTITAFNYEGEEIDRVHVAATLGGKPETTYITKSGKEIKDQLMAALK